MVVVPAVMPVTLPAASTVPTAGVALTHVPPGVNPVSDMVLPVHTIVGPDIGPADGVELTVTTVEVLQPVGTV